MSSNVEANKYSLECSDDQVYRRETDPCLISKFVANAPAGYTVLSVHPSIQLYPRVTRDRHRTFVMYKFDGETGLHCIDLVRADMNREKPTNAVVGKISIIPGGYNVEYKNYCHC